MYPLVFHDCVEVGYLARYLVISPQPLHWALESRYTLFRLTPVWGNGNSLPSRVPFLSLRRPEITNNATKPGLVRASTSWLQQGASQLTRARKPGPYAQVTHLESKPSSAKTSTSGCWVLSSKHCTLISNDPPGFFFWFNSRLGLVDGSCTPTLCVLWTLALWLFFIECKPSFIFYNANRYLSVSK